MNFILMGLAGLSLVFLAAFLMSRHETLVSWQAHVTQARLALNRLLWERCHQVEFWCRQCEQKNFRHSYLEAIKGQLGQIALSKDRLSAERLEAERALTDLVRKGFAELMEQSIENGRASDFFRQSLRSLRSLEKDIGDAQEFYNDCVARYNVCLSGWEGAVFRRWEKHARLEYLSLVDTKTQPRRSAPRLDTQPVAAGLTETT